MRRFVFILLALSTGLAGGGVASAQVTAKFQAEHQRLQAAGRQNALDHGLTEGQLLRNVLLNPFASPGTVVQKVRAGSSLNVSVRGDFPAGTRVLSERDGITLSDVVLSTTTYSAHLTIPPDEAPGFVRLWAFNPIGIEGPTAVALVDTLYRFDLKSPSGYRIKVSPVEKTFTIRDNKHAQVKYQAEFHKPGEERPFETVTGYQTFYVGDAPLESHTPYARLDISFDQSTTSPQAELDKLNEQMGDPRTTEAERNALLARMGEVQRKMLEEMSKGLQTDPASLNKQQDDFGCGYMQLYPHKDGVVEGSFSCGKNFSDGVLKVAGTMTQLH